MKNRQMKTGFSIREKITLLTTGVSLFALTSMGVISIAYEWFTDREAMGNELRIQADIIAKNSVIPLNAEYQTSIFIQKQADKSAEKASLSTGLNVMQGPGPGPGPGLAGPHNPGGPNQTDYQQYFNDTLVADFNVIGTLNTLQSNKQIETAAIYTKAGRIFSKHIRQGSHAEAPPEPGEEMIDLGYDHIYLFHPILDKDGHSVGTVYIRSDLGALWNKTKGYSIIILAVGLGAFLLAYLLSILLQFSISGPVLDLAQTAKRVSENKDYSIRAKYKSRDEVGALVSSFNLMLGTIEERETSLFQMTEQLKESNIALEEKVRMRTADLAQAMQEAQVARDEALDAAQTKGRFPANMSHEIRTPVNAIVGLTGLALKTELPSKAAEQLGKVRTASDLLLGIINDIEQLGKVRTASDSLLSIINDILDSSKLEAGCMDTPDTPAELRGMQVLIVDDNAISRDILSEMLSSFHMIPHAVDSGEAALALFEHSEKTPYDLILMDWRMPGLDGLETARRLQEMKESQGLSIPKVVMVSAYSLDDLQKQANEVEIKAYLSKPANPSALFRTIMEIFGQKTALTDLRPEHVADRMDFDEMEGDQEKCLTAGMNDFVSKPIQEKELLSTLAKWAAPDEGRKQRKSPYQQPKTEETDPEAVALPDVLPGIDLADGLKRLRGKENAYRRVLMGFPSHHAEDAENIRKFLDEGDLEKAAHAIHAIKGASGNMSANSLFTKAKELEAAVLQKRKDSIPDLLEAFTNSFKEVIKSCRSLAKQQQAEKINADTEVVPPFNFNEVASQFYELAGMIAKNSFNAQKGFVKLQEKLQKYKAVDVELKELEACIGRLDFKHAGKVLEQMQEKLKTLS